MRIIRDKVSKLTLAFITISSLCFIEKSEANSLPAPVLNNVANTGNMPCFSWSNLGAGVTYNIVVSEYAPNSDNKFPYFWIKPDYTGTSLCWNSSLIHKKRTSSTTHVPTGRSTPSTLESGRVYFWKIVARHKTATGLQWVHSSARSFRTAAPPGVPILRAPINGSESPDKPCFHWQGGSNSTGYNVVVSEYAPDSNNQYPYFWVNRDVRATSFCWSSAELVHKRRVNPTFDVVTGQATPISLLPGKTYSWKVVARNDYKPGEALFSHAKTQRFTISTPTPEPVVNRYLATGYVRSLDTYAATGSSSNRAEHLLRISNFSKAGGCKVDSTGFVRILFPDNRIGTRMHKVLLAAQLSAKQVTIIVDDSITDQYGSCYLQQVRVAM